MRLVAIAALSTILLASAAQAEPLAQSGADSGQAATAATQKVSEVKAGLFKRQKAAQASHRAQEARFWAEVRRRREELARLLAHPPAPQPAELRLVAPVDPGYRGPVVEPVAAHGACASISCSRYVLLGVGY